MISLQETHDSAFDSHSIDDHYIVCRLVSLTINLTVVSQYCYVVAS
jgi:hypothetical protein